jgi:hypothetical protein
VWGAPEIPSVDVVYEEAMLLARHMKKDIADYYGGCPNPKTGCHLWHSMGADGTRIVLSGTVI